MFLHMHFTSRTVNTSLVLMLGVVMMLLVVAVLGLGEMEDGLSHVLHRIWSLVISISNWMEMSIEGTGWIIGRAVGRFGRGLERGYRS